MDHPVELSFEQPVDHTQCKSATKDAHSRQDRFFSSYTAAPNAEILKATNVLAVVNFNGQSNRSTDPRVINSGLNLLNASPVTEVIYSTSPVTVGSCEGLNWSKNEEMLLVSAHVDEAEYAGIEAATEDVYQKLLRFIGDAGYSHIVRVWNYLADINLGEGDEERYKQFCAGRHRAFEQVAPDAAYPSACALGHDGGSLVVYLLASKTGVEHYENPDQISAFRYPRQYGPKSPSFARASCVDWSDWSMLFLSGTASIKGHETLHEDDVSQQVSVTADNIQRLFDSICESRAERDVSFNNPENTVRLETIKVYIRHKAQYQQIRRVVETLFPSVNAIYLRGDICRSDLAVEIDGHAYF